MIASEDMESAVAIYSRELPATFSKAQQHLITDTQGHTWIYFLSGAGALNYRHNPIEQVKAVTR